MKFKFFRILFCTCHFLSLVHGCPRTQHLLVDVGSGHVCVIGCWNRLWEGVCTVCVPSAGTAIWFLLPGNVIIFNYYYNI